MTVFVSSSTELENLNNTLWIGTTEKNRTEINETRCYRKNEKINEIKTEKCFQQSLLCNSFTFQISEWNSILEFDKVWTITKPAWNCNFETVTNTKTKWRDDDDEITNLEKSNEKFFLINKFYLRKCKNF